MRPAPRPGFIFSGDQWTGSAVLKVAWLGWQFRKFTFASAGQDGAEKKRGDSKAFSRENNMPAIIPVAIDLFFHWWRKTVGLLLLMATMVIPPVAAQSPTPEYQVKGAFLFNFAQFTEWPSHAFNSPDAIFVIGVLGKDPFGKFLDEFVRGEKIHGHPIEIRRYHDVQTIGSAHVLFIHDDFELSGEDLRRLSQGHHILTVSDSPGFSQKGGIINFYQENKKIRFEVNLGAVREADLTLSSKLLRLAKICCNTGN